MIKTCPQCGEQFATLNGRQIFCSAKCGQKFRDNKRQLRRPVFTRVCPQCGEQFATTNSTKKFCSDRCCRKFHSTCAAKKATVEIETVEPPKMPIARCYNCGHEFRQTFKHEKFCGDDCRFDYFKLDDTTYFFSKMDYFLRIQEA